MQFADLQSDVAERLPEERRKAVEALVAEFGASDTFRFLMTLTAGSSKRERHVLRMLLRELDRLDQQAG